MRMEAEKAAYKMPHGCQLGLWKLLPVLLKRWGCLFFFFVFFPSLPSPASQHFWAVKSPTIAWKSLRWVCSVSVRLCGRWPLVQHCGWSSKLSLQREKRSGGDKTGKADMIFFPHALVMFRDLSIRCWSSPVFFGLGARTRTEPASKFGSCWASLARHVLGAISTWERNGKGGGEHLAFRLEMGQWIKKVSLKLVWRCALQPGF